MTFNKRNCMVQRDSLNLGDADTYKCDSSVDEFRLVMLSKWATIDMLRIVASWEPWPCDPLNPFIYKGRKLGTRNSR